MRSGLGLCVLGLLGLHNLVMAESGVRIFCDDPSVEKAVHSAVDKFNQGLAVGQKMALYQIVSAAKSESADNTVYSLQFTTRRTTCVFSDTTPWTDCDYLPEKKEPFPCNATVDMVETSAEIREVDCSLEDHIVSNKAPCLGCPVVIDTTSEDLKNPLSLSVSKFNLNWNHTHLFKINKVVHATRRVLAGFRFKVRFDLQKTTCAKADHADLNDLCEVDVDDMEFANCNATVDVAPWRRHEVPNVELDCEEGELRRPMGIDRRRPPGWSPLRNMSRVNFNQAAADPPTTAAPATAVPPPTAVPTKDTSSEEDSTSSKVCPAPAPDSPFHCPSKPWKAFTMEAEAPTAPAEEEKGTLSDSDLLA